MDQTRNCYDSQTDLMTLVSEKEKENISDE
jgi:hypothetical protein